VFPTEAVCVSDDRLVRVLAFVADHATAHRTVVSSRSACDACVSLLDVDGSGLTLMNGSSGQGEARYATDKTGLVLEETQFTLGEGPAVDAFRSAMPVLVPDLDAAPNHRRWPVFTPVAVTAGVRAVFVFPLRSGAIRLGTLAAHRSNPLPLTSEQVANALVVADVILSQLLNELIPPASRQDVRAVDGLLPLSRAQVHQAAGMVSAQLEVGLEEAMTRLRGYAFAHDLPIAEVAREVVARRLKLEPKPDSV
jgi:hypothetical protein